MSGGLFRRFKALAADAGLHAGDGVAFLLATMMLLVPAVGVPHEYLLQDTLKSMMVAFLALGAAWLLLWRLRSGAEPVRWHGLLWLPLLLMAYALGSMVWSHSYLAGVEAVRWFVFAVLLWVGLNSLTRRRMHLLIKSIHYGAVMASLWAVIQFWFDFDWFPQAAAPASTFVNRNFFAEFVVCTLPFSVWLLVEARGETQIVSRALFIGFNLVALLMTGTRSALAALLLLLLALTGIVWRYQKSFELARWPRSHKWLALAALLATVAGLGVVETGSPRIAAEMNGLTAIERGYFRAARMMQKTEYTLGSASSRLLMWRSTARMIDAHPWLGVGAGAWEVVLPRYQTNDSSLEHDYNAHNEILQLIAEYGLVGWSMLLALSAYLLRAAWVTWCLGRIDPKGQEAPWRAMTLAALLAFLVVSNAGFPWRLAATGALFALCLAILAASDLRLKPQRVSHPGMHAWRPWGLSVALVAVAAGMGLTVWISLQAAAAESRLIGALKLATGINMSGDPLHPRHDARKAELLRLVREGIAINPHYRKITPIVADQLVRWGDWRNALWIWESVVASRPNVVALLANTAQAHIQLGELPQAEAYFERARAIQPDAPVVNTLEVLLLVHRGELAQAAQLSRTYLQRPQFDQGLTLTAYLLGLRTQDWELAIQALTQRRLRWPQLAVDSWYKLGQMYARPELRNEVHAQQAFQAALDAAPATFRDKVREAIPQPYRSALRPPAP